MLEHDGRDVVVHNIGEGTPLNTFFADDDDEVKAFVGSVASDGRVPLSHRPPFDVHHKYKLYCHDVQRGILGRRLWTRTTLHATGFGRDDERPFITDHARRILLVPAMVRRRARLETPWEHLQRLDRWYSPNNWRRRAHMWWLPRYRNENVGLMDT